VETFLSRMQRAGRDLVKGGLPQMEDRAIYEKHLARPVAGPQPAPETGGGIKSASLAAHDYDLVPRPETIPASCRGREKSGASPAGPHPTGFRPTPLNRQ